MQKSDKDIQIKHINMFKSTENVQITCTWLDFLAFKVVFFLHTDHCPGHHNISLFWHAKSAKCNDSNLKFDQKPSFRTNSGLSFNLTFEKWTLLCILQHYAKSLKRNPILKAIVLHGLSPSAGLENISSYFGKRGTGGGQIQ